MSWHDVLLFDTGSSQWRCGRAEEGGPDVVLPGIPLDKDEAWQRQVASRRRRIREAHAPTGFRQHI